MWLWSKDTHFFQEQKFGHQVCYFASSTYRLEHQSSCGLMKWFPWCLPFSRVDKTYKALQGEALRCVPYKYCWFYKKISANFFRKWSIFWEFWPNLRKATIRGPFLGGNFAHFWREFFWGKRIEYNSFPNYKNFANSKKKNLHWIVHSCN